MENMSDKQVNDEIKKTIDEEVQRSYHNVIRQMIKDENEIRNQRTNWFLVIQGFLIAGCCELYANKCLKEIFILLIMISIIGFITSCSFLYAAWRSEKSIEMALACWNIFLEKNGFTTQVFPPVILLTEGVIRNGGLANPNDNENIKYENEIFRKMYEKSKGRSCNDSIFNKFDCIMPFKAIPKLFLYLWLLTLILLILLLLVFLMVVFIRKTMLICYI